MYIIILIKNTFACLHEYMTFPKHIQVRARSVGEKSFTLSYSYLVVDIGLSSIITLIT